MAANGDDSEHEAYTVRLSARTTPSNFDKLVAVAKAKGWFNSRGQPNISKVLNHVLDRFRVPQGKKKTDG